MLEIHGKSDCLKHVHSTLVENGITEFTSIKEVNQFIASFDQKINELRQKADIAIREEIDTLQIKKTQIMEESSLLQENLHIKYSSEVNLLNNRIHEYRDKSHYPIFKQFYYHFLRGLAKYQLKKINLTLMRKLQANTSKVQNKIDDISNKILLYSTDRSTIIDQRVKSEFDRLEHIKRTIEALNPFIAGAIGEHKVVKRLKHLSNSPVLINDYKLKFSPPIYNRLDKSRIKSIQVDHLLITKAGLFIIETKNWSKKSIENRDLRSPVAQINRSSYALFRFLNESKKIKLKPHHWGEKEIAIRNVIVMINNKPNTKFKFVKIKSLDEIVGYVENFPDELLQDEIRSLSDFLLKSQDKGLIQEKTGNTRTKAKRTINEMYRDIWK